MVTELIKNTSYRNLVDFLFTAYAGYESKETEYLQDGLILVNGNYMIPKGTVMTYTRSCAIDMCSFKIGEHYYSLVGISLTDLEEA